MSTLSEIRLNRIVCRLTKDERHLIRAMLNASVNLRKSALDSLKSLLKEHDKIDKSNETDSITEDEFNTILFILVLDKNIL